MEEVEQAIIAGFGQAQARTRLVTPARSGRRHKAARTTTSQRKVVVREQDGRSGWRARQKARQGEPRRLGNAR